MTIPHDIIDNRTRGLASEINAFPADSIRLLPLQEAGLLPVKV